MANVLKNLLKGKNLKYKVVDKEKVRKYMKKFLGVSYKKKVKVPIKKSLKSHHRLRSTWIL